MYSGNIYSKEPKENSFAGRYFAPREALLCTQRSVTLHSEKQRCALSTEPLCLRHRTAVLKTQNHFSRSYPRVSPPFQGEGQGWGLYYTTSSKEEDTDPTPGPSPKGRGDAHAGQGTNNRLSFCLFSADDLSFLPMRHILCATLDEPLFIRTNHLGKEK